MFTELKEAPVVEQPVVVDAPKTRLSLVLSGVVASNDAQKVWLLSPIVVKKRRMALMK